MAHAAIILGLITGKVYWRWWFGCLVQRLPALIVGDNATVISPSGSLLAMAAIYQFSDSVQVVVSGILRGYKDTQIILTSRRVYWSVGILLVIFFPARIGLFQASVQRLLGCVYHCINYCCCFTLYIRMWKIQSIWWNHYSTVRKIEIVGKVKWVEFDRTFIFTSPPHQTVLGCSTALFWLEPVCWWTFQSLAINRAILFLD